MNDQTQEPNLKGDSSITDDATTVDTTTARDAPKVIPRLTGAAHYADRCKHFTGLMGPGMKVHERCAAGVRYEDVRVDHEGIAYTRGGEGGPPYRMHRSLPCHASSNLGGATCEKRCAPTAEEAKAEEAATQRQIQFTFEAMARIQAATKGERGVQGSIECPKCAQPLHYTVAGSNGHVHARCTTQGCLAWMQ